MTVPDNSAFIADTVTEEQFKHELTVFLEHVRTLTGIVNLHDSNVYNYAYKLDFDAEKVHIPAGGVVIINLGDEAGLYTWDGNTLVKSAYDQLLVARAYTDEAKNAAIAAAAQDAQNKADTAKTTAIDTSAIDASSKANTAQANAERIAAQALSVQRNEVLNLISNLHLALSVLNTAAVSQNQHIIAVDEQVKQTSTDLVSLVNTVNTLIKVFNLDKQDISNLYLGLQTLNLAITQLDSENQKQLNESLEQSSDFYLALQVLNQAIFALNLAKAQDQEVYSRFYLALQKIVELIAEIETSSAKTALLGTDHVYTFPAPKAIAVIDIKTARNPLPASKEDGKFDGEVTFSIDGESARMFAKMEVQGQSSAGFPKKNWSFDLYDDQALTTSALLKIGKIRAHDSVNFKANYVDHLHVRQMFNLELWQEIQNSRQGYPKQDIDNYYVGKTGKDAVPTGALAAPYMYPAVCNINGEFYGVGCIHYAKKRGNYNIAKNKPKEILIDFAGITAIDDMNPSIIEIKAPSSPTADTLAAIQRWREFAQSSSDNIKANIASYGSKQNLIDYYCFVDFICGADIVFKNLMMYSWDAKIWRIGVYDVDMTYGLDADGTVTRFTPDYDAFQDNPFWARIREAFESDIESRYAELRKSGLFSVDHVYLQMSHLLSFYPTEILSAEYSKWNPPSLSTTTFPALLEWVKQRLVFLDAKHNYTGH